MKAFMMTDVEGVAGVVQFESQTYPTGKYYEDSKRLLTAEVNAAVEGLLEAGVDEVIVRDGHGPGAINFELLHPAAKLIHGQTWGLMHMIRPIMQSCDFGMIVGQHAMAGVADGNLNHTQNSRQITGYCLNGKPVGEIAQFALEMGALGRPMIYLSGDTAACREAEELIPGIVTTSVKEGLGRNAALCLSSAAAQAKIKADVLRAVAQYKKDPAPPLVWDGPFCMEVTCTDTTAADTRGIGRIRTGDLSFKIESEDVLDVLYG